MMEQPVVLIQSRDRYFSRKSHMLGTMLKKLAHFLIPTVFFFIFVVRVNQTHVGWPEMIYFG